nr:hypothetical protein [Tanacetum cinerariifolium]
MMITMMCLPLNVNTLSNLNMFITHILLNKMHKIKNRNTLLETSNKVLVEKLKSEIADFKNKNKSLTEANNKLSVENDQLYADFKKSKAELQRCNSIEYASEMELECAKAKGDLLSYKMEYERCYNKYTLTINDLNQTVSELKDKLSAHQDTISILIQQKDAHIKLYKTQEDKEIEKVIDLENKVKVLDNIVYNTVHSSLVVFGILVSCGVWIRQGLVLVLFIVNNQGESLSKARTHFKDLLQKVPHQDHVKLVVNEEAMDEEESNEANGNVNKGKMDSKTYNLLPEGPMYNAIIKKKLVRKDEKGGNFVIPCNIGRLKFMNALADQWSDVNIMSLSIYNKLNSEKPIRTNTRLFLANHSYIYPLGIAEDVLIDVANFVYPTYFVILDIEEDECMPLILGTPFLTMAKTEIKFDKGRMTIMVGNCKIRFVRTLEHPIKIEERIKRDLL